MIHVLWCVFSVGVCFDDPVEIKGCNVTTCYTGEHGILKVTYFDFIQISKKGFYNKNANIKLYIINIILHSLRMNTDFEFYRFNDQIV